MSRKIDDATICWKCANCTDGTKCEWAFGSPVKGWVATPTVYDDGGFITHSFKVTKCPKFVEARRYEITLSAICREINCKRGDKHALQKVAKALESKGYALETHKEKGCSAIYAVKKENGR